MYRLFNFKSVYFTFKFVGKVIDKLFYFIQTLNSDINQYAYILNTIDLIPTSDFLLSTIHFWNKMEDIKFYSFNDAVLLVHFKPPFGQPSVHLFTSNLNEEKLNYAKQIAQSLSIKKIKITFNDFNQLETINKFHLEEDINEFEYVYSLKELALFEGSKFKKQRNAYSKALKDFETFSFEIINLADLKNSEEIYKFCESCILSKSEKSETNKNNLLQELDAFRKCLHLSNIFKLKIFKLYTNNVLSGILIYEELNNELIVGHFFKSLNGLGVYLLKEFSASLTNNHFKYFNFQEDRGVESLRHFKQQLNPIFYLKTYFIQL